MAITEFNNPIWLVDKAGLGKVIQTDWEEEDPSEASFLRNKPDLSRDALRETMELEPIAWTADYNDLKHNVPDLTLKLDIDNVLNDGGTSQVKHVANGVSITAVAADGSTQSNVLVREDGRIAVTSKDATIQVGPSGNRNTYTVTEVGIYGVPDLEAGMKAQGQSPTYIVNKKYVDDADILLQNNLNTEQARAEAAEADLQAQLDEEIQNRIDDVDEEQARAEEAEAVLQANIDAEAATREEVDTDLQEQIDEIVSNFDDHINDFSNPHQVSLQQAADIQGTMATLLPTGTLGIFEGEEDALNKLVTRREMQEETYGAMHYKGQLKYGALTVADMERIPTLEENQDLAVGDLCGVQETQLTYEWDGSTWVAQEQNEDEDGDLWDMLFWYGDWYGVTYHGDVTATIKCSDGEAHTWDLVVNMDYLIDNTVTDAKIGLRVVLDNDGDPDIMDVGPKTLTNWLQDTRDNMKWALDEIPKKVDIYQGVENAGRHLVVDGYGNVSVNTDDLVNNWVIEGNDVQTEWFFSHGRGTKCVLVVILDEDGVSVQCRLKYLNDNVIGIYFDYPPASGVLYYVYMSALGYPTGNTIDGDNHTTEFNIQHMLGKLGVFVLVLDQEGQKVEVQTIMSTPDRVTFRFDYPPAIGETYTVYCD